MSESDSQRTTNRAWNERALEDRALGAYLGLAIGDALGATVELSLIHILTLPTSDLV